MTTTRRSLNRFRRGDHPRYRVSAATTLLVAGRLYLVALLAVIVGCSAFRDAWAGAKIVDGLPSHWIPQVTFGFLLVFAIAWPFLLLPVSSVASTFRNAVFVEGATVLGRRRVELASVKWGRLTLPDNSYSTFVLALRDRRWRCLLVVGTGARHEGHFETVAGHTFRDTQTRVASVLRYALGCIAIIAWVSLGFLAAGTTGAALKIFGP